MFIFKITPKGFFFAPLPHAKGEDELCKKIHAGEGGIVCTDEDIQFFSNGQMSRVYFYSETEEEKDIFRRILHGERGFFIREISSRQMYEVRMMGASL